jgi:hypothetical protein
MICRSASKYLGQAQNARHFQGLKDFENLPHSVHIELGFNAKALLADAGKIIYGSMRSSH